MPHWVNMGLQHKTNGTQNWPHIPLLTRFDKSIAYQNEFKIPSVQTIAEC